MSAGANAPTLNWFCFRRPLFHEERRQVHEGQARRQSSHVVPARQRLALAGGLAPQQPHRLNDHLPDGAHADPQEEGGEQR